jgi:hypothetical protein
VFLSGDLVGYAIGTDLHLWRITTPDTTPNPDIPANTPLLEAEGPNHVFSFAARATFSDTI